MKQVLINVVLLWVASWNHLIAQQTLAHKASLAKAREIFYQAFEAEQSTSFKDLEKFYFTLEGVNTNPRQVYNVTDRSDKGPQEPEAFLGHYFYDQAARLHRNYTRAFYNGEHDLRFGELNKHDTSYYTAVQNRKYSKYPKSFQKTFEEVVNIPGLFLALAETSLSSLSWIGETQWNDESVSVIELTFLEVRRRISVSQSNGQIRQISWLSADQMLGTRQNTIQFAGRQSMRQFTVPEKLSKYVDDKLTATRTCSAFVSSFTSDEVFELASDFEPYTTVPWSLHQTSENVFEFQGLGGYFYTIPFVVFDDFVLVYDAILSPGLTKRAIDLIEEEFAPRRVRYVVLSHNHTDHISGLKAFTDRGINVVTTPLTQSRISDFINCPPNLLKPRTNAAKNEPFETQLIQPGHTMTLGDGTTKLHIHNTGPIAHVSDMLYVQVESDSVLIQADGYFEFSPWGQFVNDLTAWIRKHELTHYLITGTHHHPLSYETLISRKERQSQVVIPAYLESMGLRSE